MLPNSTDDAPTPDQRPRENRAGLVLELAQLFVLRSEHRRDDLHVFEELMGELYASADAAERRQTAELLADRADLPPVVTGLIAFDDIMVAEPVLRRGRTLTTIDRIRLVGNRSEAHRAAIATRADLEDSVISALLLHGESETIEALAANEALTLSSQQMDRLVDRVIEVGAKLHTLTDRLDLGTTRLIDMFFDLDRPTRRRALLGFDAETAFRRIEKRGRRTPPARSPDLEGRLLDAVVAFDLDAYAALLGRASGIELSLAHRIIGDRGGEPLVIALAAAGIDASGATSILVRSDPAFGWTYEGIRDLVRLYDAIGWRTAEAVLERWSARDGRRLTRTLRQVDPAEGIRARDRRQLAARPGVDRADVGNRSRG